MQRPRKETEALARAWEERARSELRDYFVASHPGWTDEEQWERCALRDAAHAFHGVSAARLARARVLEMGCGVGRLADVIAPRAASYAGFDLAPTMVARARENCARHGVRARFAVGDGAGPPPEFAHEEFDIVLCWAVLVHVSREIALANLAALYQRLAPGGELRLQFHVDPLDRERPSDAPPVDDGDPAFDPGAVELAANDFDDEPEADDERVLRHTRARADQPTYIGHSWRVDDLRAALVGLGDVEVWLDRPDPLFAYALVRRR